jgi:hypothetical protein
VDRSNVAPVGSCDTDRVTVLAGLGLIPVTVKLIHNPDVTVRLLGSVSVSGLGT